MPRCAPCDHRRARGVSRLIAIREGGLDHPAVHELLRLHLDGMVAHSPPGTVHALDLDRLRGPQIRFWTAWRGEVLLGCGALRRIAPDHGEVKSMRTHPDQLRQGVAARLLGTIIAAARADGLARLSLETGSGPDFQPALDFYARFGFVPCGRFGDYPGDSFSRFLRLEL